MSSHMSAVLTRTLKVVGAVLCLAAARAAAGAQEAAVRGPALDAGSVLHVMLGLGVVLLVIVALAWLARNVLRFQPTVRGQLRILGGLSMGTRERVVLVQVGETQLLLGVAPGRIQALHVLEHPISTAADEPSPPAGFSDQLARALKRTREGRGND